MIRQATIALALGTASVTLVAAPAVAAGQAARPSETLNISQSTGTMVRLASPMSDVFVANDKIADVQVRSSRQLYIFGKSSGETTVYATDKAGRVVYAANVRVGNNLGSVGEMLHLAMPDAAITATPMNDLMLLTGTVASPDDAAEAERLVKAYVGQSTSVVSRLRTATPLQVMLKVRVAEVSRSIGKQIGVNLLSRDTTGGFNFGIGQGNPGTISTTGAKTFNVAAAGTTLGAAGKLLGLDILGTLDLAEQDGLVSTLAEPTLTALSGETASFLAGGEFPIPISQGLGDAITVEYKQYGVGLAFTPIVLADGHISMRIRPEVSELSSSGAIKLNGYEVPAITTRRTETTVELGSGQSMMISGLLKNSNNNNVSKAPFLGDLPVLGALFRSTKYQRDETELVVVVTPYLVRPVSGQIALPTNGYRAPSDTQLTLEGKTFATNPGGVAARPAAPVPVAALPAPGFSQ
ncbi:type II and III secretion system protein family protein [Sphingomonas sp. ASV193]|uniref:type II and III secretion system protein family protein n=1 Tax=Sphingomonas sp. ASV193 TaxID=3144405 RepID=UPI0032E85078